MPTPLRGERVAEDDEAADDSGDVGRSARDCDHWNRLAVLEALGRSVEGNDGGQRR